MNEEMRAKFLFHVRENLGAPYLWGGQSPAGFDCSGFVVYCLQKAGIKIPDMTASSVFNSYFHLHKKMITLAQPGDLLFYGNSVTSLTHVMVCLNRWQNGTFAVAGARGGDSKTLNQDIAKRQGAFCGIVIDYWKAKLQACVDPFMGVI